MEIVQLVDLAAVDTFIWQKLKVMKVTYILIISSVVDGAVVVCVKFISKKPRIGIKNSVRVQKI